MTLTRGEFMAPPGSGLPSLPPIGGVKAGRGIRISATGVMSIASGMPLGTHMLFFQAAAPQGWTTLTSIDNRALRIVSGSGGGVGGTNPFTTSFASYTPSGTSSLAGFRLGGSTGGSSVANSQLASHLHGYQAPSPSGSNATGPGLAGVPFGAAAAMGGSGSNGQHSHPYSGSISGQSSFTGSTTTQFEVQYLDILVCQRDS